MNEYGLTKNEISKKLYSLLSIDETFTSGKIIGSMCTEPDSYSKYIYSKFLEKNIGDPGLFKGTLLLEKQIINQIGKLLFYSRCSGFVVSGGTEANIMAMWSARNYSNKIKYHQINILYYFAALLLYSNLKCIACLVFQYYFVFYGIHF